MLKWFFPTVALLFICLPMAHAGDGLVVVRSAHPVAETADRLQAALLAADFRIFARVDHAAGAHSVGMPLPPTELLIFGKPAAGTRLMQSQRRVGIDLPLKYLVWEDAQGSVKVAWNDPAWVAERHAIGDQGTVVKKIQAALEKFAAEAIGP